MPSSTINNKLPLGVSLGEPAGIGPEVILKSWLARTAEPLPPFCVLGSARILQMTARDLGLDIPLKTLERVDQTVGLFDDFLPVLDLGQAADFTYGQPSTDTAPLVIDAIAQGVDLFFSGDVAGLVTAPIQKSVLYEAGFNHPGHTEYLAELCGKKTTNVEVPVMMLVSDQLRVVPLTIHMPLAQVAQTLTSSLIQTTCDKINTALQRDFGLSDPRIAVAGLNPHAGEQGTMGQEEEKIITPALDLLRSQGLNIIGPLPADTMFHAAARTNYDAALCMYHDQALIPIKTLDFDGGVNVTIGLPLVRTSPDHGTALDIAGKGRANPQSMINALKQAHLISENRQKWAKNNV